MANYPSPALHSGFTLVELMTTLTVALLLLVIGVPSFSTLLANNQMAATTNDLVSHLQYARSESVKRQMPVSVCSSDNGESCTGSNEWGVGWIVFTDDSGTVGNLDSSDQLLRKYQPNGPFVSILSVDMFIRYASDGSISM
ncbi:MAG: GspH/FimT family pseudopilin [Candidatus Thiodiazotropha sp.]|jgi:type IV fimbrial biogenesis protein FimT